ncbi:MULTISPECIES: hypothetical protein [unclassified Desulfosporosinus]|uniref:hypothetical protein n=1 Tax=unclassified Desulfosporosinus TaxID=2633794 RepID=UPI000223A078|nr:MULTISPECIES: hypothetical protein [unclassified Desulfosporosinus]EGW36658.1 hypothetical protein DOT_5523 [Desulfosporosinus sp. OT]
MSFEIFDGVNATLDREVSDFMRENDCDIEDACNALGINYTEAYDYHFSNDN